MTNLDSMPDCLIGRVAAGLPVAEGRLREPQLLAAGQRLPCCVCDASALLPTACRVVGLCEFESETLVCLLLLLQMSRA